MLRIMYGFTLLITTLFITACGTDNGETTDAGADNTAPQNYTVDAGADQITMQGSLVTLAGNTDLDESQVAAYAWRQLSGISITLNNANTATASFIAPAVDTTQVPVFQFSVTDNNGTQIVDSVNITISAGTTDNPSAPIANAGEDLNVPGRQYVTHIGYGTDADGTISAYSWTQVAGKEVIIENPDSDTLSFEAPLVVGNELLRFELTVTDNQGNSATDLMDVTVTDKGSAQVVAAIGMPAVGYPDDYIYYSVARPAIGRNGHVAFFGVADTSIRSTVNASNALWAGMADNLQLIAREGDNIIGLPGNIQFNSVGAATTPVVTESGHVGFFARLQGAVNNATNVAIMAKVGQNISSVIRAGTSAPGLPATSVVSGLTGFSFTDAGMLISGMVDISNPALWYWDFNTLTLIAMADLANKYTVPEETLSFDSSCSYASVTATPNIIFNLNGGGINNQGEIVFFALFTDTDCSSAAAILGWKDGNLRKIIELNDPVENMSDARFSSFSVLDINDNGDVLLGSTIVQTGSGAKSAVWLIPNNDQAKLIAIDGELVPDEFNSALTLLSSTSLVSNSGNVLSLLADIQGGAFINYSLLLGSARSSQPYNFLTDTSTSRSQLDLIIKQNSEAPLYTTGSIIDFNTESTISFNNNDEVAFSANVYDPVVDQVHNSVWLSRGANDFVELIKTGQNVRINGSEQAIKYIYFQGGSINSGRSAQLDDAGRLFIRTQTESTFQANILLTPSD